MAGESFDYTKIGQPDNHEPFSVAELIGSMSSMKESAKKGAAFVGGFFGDPGTHKTVNTMKLAQMIVPKDKKILYVYTGQGWSSLMNHRAEKLSTGETVDLMDRVVKMPYIRREQLETLFATLLNPTMKEKLQIGAVVFDEINRMQDMDTDKLTQHRAKLLNAAQEKASPSKKLKDKNGADLYKDPYTPEWPEYNTTKVKMISLINDALTLEDMHFFFVCHTRFQKGTGMIEPDFPEKTGAAFISMVHSLYYTKKVDVAKNGSLVTEFPIELQGTQQTVSKNRIGGLPPVVYSPEEIALAYKKWGVIEESSPALLTTVQEDKPAIADSTLENASTISTVSPGTPGPLAGITATAEEADPIAAIMG